MLTSARITAFALCAIAAGPVFAQSIAAGPNAPLAIDLPDWPVGGEPQPQTTPATTPAAATSVYAAPQRYGTPLPPVTEPEPRVDREVQPALHSVENDAAKDDAATPDKRRLAPRSDHAASRVARSESSESPANAFSRLGLPADSLVTTFSALAFVLGLFFLCAWLMKRGGRKKPGYLPAEVVSVLGRTAIAPKQFAELMRVGNKLVLVALTPDGPKPLTEVTDAAEVDRLLGLCHERDPRSTSRAFEQVFRDLSHDPAPLSFLGHEAPIVTAPPDIAIHRPTRGGTARA